jgi:hypothetical protein
LVLLVLEASKMPQQSGLAAEIALSLDSLQTAGQAAAGAHLTMAETVVLEEAAAAAVQLEVALLEEVAATVVLVALTE